MAQSYEAVIPAQELLDAARATSDESNQQQRQRIFVRELAGKYSEVYRQIFSGPRVIHAGDKKWGASPQLFSKSLITPQDTETTQLFHCGLKILAPGGKSGNHGHMNSAIFYIMEGEGYDVHDGVKLPYKAGDVCIVEPGCVHQHFNSDPEKPLKVLMIKSKPIFLFSNLGFQRGIERAPEEAVPGWEGWMPEEVIADGWRTGADQD